MDSREAFQKITLPQLRPDASDQLKLDHERTFDEGWQAAIEYQKESAINKIKLAINGLKEGGEISHLDCDYLISELSKAIRDQDK